MLGGSQGKPHSPCGDGIHSPSFALQKDMWRKTWDVQTPLPPRPRVTCCPRAPRLLEGLVEPRTCPTQHSSGMWPARVTSLYHLFYF